MYVIHYYIINVKGDKIMKKENELKKEEPKACRYSLYLNPELKEFMSYMVWKNRLKNPNEFINKLIQKEMENFIANGGSEEAWKRD